MSNYTKENLIAIPPTAVPAGTLAMKVGNEIFTPGNIRISSGGSMDFYKCAAVYGPKKATYINVAGAGTSAVNGDYEKTEITNESGGEVWKHKTADYYYYQYSEYWCINADYNADGWSALYYSYDSVSWYIGYDYDTDTWTGESPAPTVTERQETLDAQKTWDGYKAVLTDGVYAFEETVTEGLTYGNGYTPTVGEVYADGALLSIKRLWSGTVVATPSALYVPLSYDTDTAETGQMLTYSGNPQFTVIDNIPCMFFDGSTYITVEDDDKMKEVISKQALTISFWVYIISVSGFAGLVTHCTGSRSYGIFMDSSSFVAVAQIPDERNAKNSLAMAENNWVHVCMTAGNGVIKVYYNGIKQPNTATFDTIPGSSTALTIGGWNFGSHNGYIAAVRVFSEVVEDTDIEKLASEFTPTA